MRLRRSFLVWACASPFAGCGYHVAGKADLIPKHIQTIAVPEFANATRRYRQSEGLTKAIVRELISRSRFSVVADPAQADAILSGAVINFFSFPTVVDPATSRATASEVVVQLQVKLTDRTNNKVLLDRPSFEVRERYEISIDPRAYFEESDVAMDRLSRDVARSIVSAVLEL